MKSQKATPSELPYVLYINLLRRPFKIKCLVENWIEGLLLYFSLEFLFLIGQDIDLDVGVGGAVQVHRGKVVCVHYMYLEVICFEVVI